MSMDIARKNSKAENNEGARSSIIYQDVLAQMRYMETLQYIKGKNVLDIACGIGWGSYLMAKSGANKITGVLICRLRL